jgi:inhibitor of KinA
MSTYHPYTIFPLGDSALTIEFGNSIDENINKRLLQLFYQLKEANIPYVTDIIPAYSTLTICYDVFAVGKTETTAFETVAKIIENVTSEKQNNSNPSARLIEVPVCYDAKFALDMDEIAKQKKLSKEEIIEIHTSGTYRVYMLGFLPGFAYMAEVDEQITMPRKAQPRLNIEAGSVGITGKQTGIYPLASPGGWQIIGRTPLQLFDKEAEKPVLFKPGDEVKFISITANEFENYQGRNS